jgi:tRNA threonylcarbamoyladenosine biosynthesis protein TsaB
MRIVAVDTAGPNAGVAVLDEDGIRSRFARIERGAERFLVPWLRELRPEGYAGFDAVAIAIGPGAFTGIRVGLATGLGVAMALKIPVVPVLSLESRARAAGEARVLSMLDARKGRMYAAWYEAGVSVGPVVDATITDILAGQSTPFVATGEGAVVCREAIAAAGGIVPENADDPALDWLCLLGLQRVADAIPAEDVRPFYLREADAVPQRSRI